MREALLDRRSELGEHPWHDLVEDRPFRPEHDKGLVGMGRRADLLGRRQWEGRLFPCEVRTSPA